MKPDERFTFNCRTCDSNYKNELDHFWCDTRTVDLGERFIYDDGYELVSYTIVGVYDDEVFAKKNRFRTFLLQLWSDLPWVNGKN